MPVDEIPRVALMESIHPMGIELLTSHCIVDRMPAEENEEFEKILARADAVIIRSTPFTEEMMKKSPKLKIIGRHGAGTDNIDLSAAEKLGIKVVTTPQANTGSVAEYVLTVALMLLKRIPEVTSSLRRGNFSSGAGSLPGQVDRAGLTGREANGTRLGLIGAGAIGATVAQHALQLGMHVTAYDPFLDRTKERSFALVDDMDELLSCSDIVSLHVPGGPESQNLIGRRELELLPPGAILINAARGELVDQTALIAALESGHLSGAALDVYAPEPPDTNSALFSAPNLVLTPHMAAMTEEALKRMSTQVTTQVIQFLDEYKRDRL
ncbi:hydroxyacid dehydrogenase [Paeniglutamicibacter gangotriensis]|uniref:D-3-phosphoglycerate dehydrogenase n=1 Tax=Paeniglutamicibacter gangotriensis Lz1y TaxID=1276920 RepID=M7MMZ2_9MICC|nr:hydroxyacid dehydrogenase [Paeniglutamicibacter gangotriensis]EMQ97722.1 D-3-phosphoglycerate dehydrogenase [Paeniglutamicibacter gangotriensis Lz1y]